MKWFSKNKKDNQIPSPADMTPLQAVTHLCACIQLSDGDANFEEKKAWLNGVSNLFPSFSEERADKFLNEAHVHINNSNHKDLIAHTEMVLKRIKEVLNYIHNYLNTNPLAEKSYKRAFGNMVLTGGTANLLGVSELTKNIFGVRARIAKPKMLEHMPKEHDDTKFSTAYGLILHALHNANHSSVEFKDFSNKGMVLNRIRKISRYNQLSDFLRKYF